MGVCHEIGARGRRRDGDGMKELIRRTSAKMGNLTKVGEVYREETTTLRDAFVTACGIVAETYKANKLIRAGLAAGWRFLVQDDGFVELWVPATALGRPVKYIFQNAILARVLAARGNGLIREEK